MYHSSPLHGNMQAGVVHDELLPCRSESILDFAATLNFIRDAAAAAEAELDKDVEKRKYFERLLICISMIHFKAVRLPHGFFVKSKAGGGV